MAVTLNKRHFVCIIIFVIGLCYFSFNDISSNISFFDKNKLKELKKRQDTLLNHISKIESIKDSLDLVISTNKKQLNKYKNKINEISKRFSKERISSSSSSPDERSRAVLQWIKSSKK